MEFMLRILIQNFNLGYIKSNRILLPINRSIQDVKYTIPREIHSYTNTTEDLDW